jgi:hypothetical protein
MAVSPAGAAGSADVPPVALAGTLPRDSHSVRLSVDLLPTAEAMERLDVGESLPVYRVPAAEVDAVGRGYTVRIDPLALPSGYLDNKGMATAKVLAQDVETGALSTTVLSVRAVRASTASAPAWVDATNSAFAGPDVSVARYAADDPKRRVPVSAAAVEAGPVEAPALRTLEGSAQLTAVDAARGIVPDWCDSGPGPRMRKKAESLRWATIGTTYPVGRSKARMVVSSSQGASYGIGASMSGSRGSWDVSGSRHTESGWSKAWLPSNYSRSYQKQVEYFKWKYEYMSSICNHYHWIPNAETGGTASNEGIARPDGWRHYCAHEDVGPWWRDRSDGSAYTYGESVKFADVLGINLSISRQYSSAQTVRYFIRGHRKYMCGSNTWPSFASKIVERWR